VCDFDAGCLQKESCSAATTTTSTTASSNRLHSVSPDTVQPGQAATLSWQTSGATDVSVDGIGAVQASGSQQVTPSESTTYHLVAKVQAELKRPRRA